MARQHDDISRLGQDQMDTALKAWGEAGKRWQAISAEMADYSKRSLDDGTKTLQTLMMARSVQQAMEIQTTYAKRCYDDYMRQMTRLGTMYSELAKETARPIGLTMPQDDRR